jgi:hypothetical protein
VLIHLDFTFIPRCCISDRWTKNAKSVFPSDRKGGVFKVVTMLYTHAYMKGSLGHQACIYREAETVSEIGTYNSFIFVQLVPI